MYFPLPLRKYISHIYILCRLYFCLKSQCIFVYRTDIRLWEACNNVLQRKLYFTEEFSGEEILIIMRKYKKYTCVPSTGKSCRTKRLLLVREEFKLIVSFCRTRPSEVVWETWCTARSCGFVSFSKNWIMMNGNLC